MRVPVGWLTEHVALPEGTTPDRIAEAFIRVGLEVEDVRRLGPVTGPLVVGLVLQIEELTGFNKPIRYCKVDVGEDEPRGVICGATNFVEGDLVVVALPGSVLPGDFAISARQSYGHVSDGMICSLRELGIGHDHTGILVLPAGTATHGDDAIELLGLTDTVIELAITPDRGYCFSVRGLARELACAFDAPYGDPGSMEVPEASGQAWPVHIEDRQGCRRFVTRRVSGIRPGTASPWWLQRRLLLAGMRPISLPVDVTNYVMLELGQPLHAFNAERLSGGLVVRRGTDGDKLITLDGVERIIDPDDLVICDDSGPVSLAAVMGGASTEVSGETTDVLLEAANWEPATVARSARRHKLPSEAAKRFEREVDPALPPAAVEFAAQLLTRYAGGTVHDGRTDVGVPVLPETVTMPLDLPDRIAGVRYERGVSARRLGQIGCRVEVVTADDGHAMVAATPPTWRPDLRQPADLVEEVLRLEGYDTIPSELPAAPAGHGLTPGQRRRRAVSVALASAGYTEVLPSPFTSSATWSALGLGPDDVRRRTLTLLNPLDAERAELATTLLPGLIEALTRNVSRGQRDLALYGIGQVVLPHAQPVPMPPVGVAARPEDAQVATLNAALPAQPVHVGVVLCGAWELPGWWGPGREVSWADAVAAAHVVADAAGARLRVVASDLAPWHPGRCAELRVGDWPVGHAGELHPKVVEALGLPRRTCAMEIDLDAIPLLERHPAPAISPFPPVLQDIALVVDSIVPVAELTETLRRGAGPLLEDIRLFDVYTGEQIGAGKRSVAFALRFRAPDRTLTVEEATAARDAAVKAAATRHAATLRT
ncbi:MAG TPA: phenylalanine--tRNA ligase subunit beta [Pseudonocardiaceae bacterium]|nr:phenylalanine--tRNA ligase subunit beta [Pseudonocardiaceae bacterium]